MQNASKTTERVSQLARDGGVTVRKSITGLTTIRDSISASAVVMKEMDRRVEEIGDIVQTINLIADRTNLLSLNASIEAARAGDHGRGFAVVAEEIRALADRAATASGDVAKIVRGLQQSAREAVGASTENARAAEEGSRLAESAGEALNSILGGIAEVATSVRDVERASDEQSQAVTLLGRSATRLNDETRAIARNVAEQSQTTQPHQGRLGDALDGEADARGHRRAGPRAA